MADNALYYGDNLDILRHHVADESVDLVYLDPPFKSDQNYNVLFAEKDGTAAAAQIHAFEDTWHWDMAAAESFAETVEAGGDVSRALQAFRDFIGENDMLAYLSMMAPRLVEMRRVLKPTGSLYLHCDPTASHYLKLLLDAVFGGNNFRSEIIWLRSKNPKGSQHKLTRLGPATDTLLFYAKTHRTKLYADDIRIPLSDAELLQKYNRSDDKGPFMDGPILCAPTMGPRPNLVYEYKGFTPGPAGWRVNPTILEEIDAAGNLGWSKSGAPRRKWRPEDDKGDPVGSFWGDIPPINSQAQERLGYPTQKPVALLDRIITASSRAGDTVLDPFCGCGTTIDASQKLGRNWIGIDITHLAITLIKHRLRDTYGDSVSYEIHGEPASVSGAEALALQDRYQFEWWALGLVGARPQEKKKGADKGIDGRLYFFDEAGGKAKQIILSVKSGKPKVSEVRDLVGVLDRERAQIGVYITLQPPTGPMKKEAASAGFYESPQGKKFARLQILTIEELLEGDGIDYWSLTGGDTTFKKAPKAVEKKHEHQHELLG